MAPLGRCFRAELVKWRKSWALLAGLLAPVCQTGFLFLVLWFAEDLVVRFRPGFAFWVELNYLAWNLVFLPILAALVSQLSWDLELEAHAWDRTLVQPLPRGAHFLGKLLSHLYLLGISQILLAVLVFSLGWWLRLHHGQIMGAFPSLVWIQFASFSLLAYIPLTVFHTWLSSRWPGMGLGLIVAVAGTWCCTRLAGATSLVQLLPWGMNSQAVVFFNRWNRHIPWSFFLGSFIVTGMLIYFGQIDFVRRVNIKK